MLRPSRLSRLPRRRVAGSVAFLVLALSAGAVRAGDPPDVPLTAAGPAIGAVVAGLELKDLSGQPHDIASAAGARVTVLAFNGVGCPIAQLYAPRLERLHQAYRERGVRVLGVNSNAFDRVEDLRRFASANALTFPILKDHDHAAADLLGAERMTAVFVIDAERKLRYRGRFDDQYAITERSVGVRKPEAETRYVEAAVTAILEGRDVETPSTDAAGCVIGRARKVADAVSVTFHRDVEPIVQKRCQPCHREGDIAPFELASYDDVAGWAGMIREVVVNRRMPPWHADPAHGRFENDRSLPPDEVATLVRWIDNGAPRGDPADAPPPAEFPEGWKLGEPDAVFEMPKAFDVPAEGTLSYKHVTVPTSFAEDRWVRATEVQAGVRSVVHHILVFAADPKDPRRWRRETAGGTRGYFAILVPGERPTEYPEGMAKRLPAGATLIFQIHYTTNGTATQDRSRIGLYFARGPARREVVTRSAVNQLLMVPAGAERHPVSASYRFRKPGRILALLPHMHLRGESARYELRFPGAAPISKAPRFDDIPAAYGSRIDYEPDTGRLTYLGRMPEDLLAILLAMYDDPADRAAIEALQRDSRSEILLDVPRYDFGWQSSYRLATPLAVPAGAVLAVTMHFNNSRSNPALTEAMSSRPVFWGEQTWQEMMIGYFDFVEDGP